MSERGDLQKLLTWLSPAFPVGAFAWSAGLETAIVDRRIHDRTTTHDWIEASLANAGLRTDAIQLDDGRLVEVIAAPELLYEIRARDTDHLVRLAWHIGNRHTSAQLEASRILIKRDHVLKTMLEGLGAIVTNVSEPFFAEHGAYHSHAESSHALLAR